MKTETLIISAQNLLPILDGIGVFVFALSGGIVAIRARMDVFGAIVMAFLPAVGGGTMRDLILDQPVFWLENTISLWVAMAGGILAYMLPEAIDKLRPLRWADAVGLSLFAAVGAAKAHALGYGLLVTIIMATMTAAAGGLIRDVVANRTPLVLQADIYATAAIVGGAGYWIAREGLGFAADWALLICIVIAFSIRAAALVFNLSLPVPNRSAN